MPPNQALVGKRCAPHLYIPSLMEEPERLHASEPRGGLKVGVALISSTGIVYVQALTGTTAKRLKPGARYATQAGHRAKGLTSTEYEAFMQRVLGCVRRRGKHYIVHDRDPSHRGAGGRKLVEGAGHHLILLPPRSPDLDPLDYAVFDNAKKWLAREKPAGMVRWERRCDAFVHHLQRLDPMKVVGNYVQRLQKVIAAQGGHFEGARKQ